MSEVSCKNRKTSKHVLVVAPRIS